MSYDNKSAVYSKPLFHRSGVRGQTVSGFGRKVYYGGANEAAGETTHSDRASGYDNLTVVVSSVMTLLDCVGVTLVVIAVCMTTYVISTFSLVLVGFSDSGMGLLDLTGLVFGLMTTSACRVADGFGFVKKAFVAEPFTLVNFLSIVVSRILSVVLSEFLVPKSTRALSAWVKSMLVVASLLTAAYLTNISRLDFVTSCLQVFLLTLADLGIFCGTGIIYLAALSTLVFHPAIVILYALLCYKFRWFTYVGGRARDDPSGIARPRFWSRKGNRGVKQQRLEKSSRDFLKKLTSITGLYTPRMFEYATVQQWQSFGAVGLPNELDKCLRGLALYGDREMASMIARVGLRDEWDVQECSEVSQRLLTNAAFAKYFDVKLQQLFPQMRFSSEKRKGTLVEAIVGAAALEPGSYAAIERFVLADVRNAFGDS